MPEPRVEVWIRPVPNARQDLTSGPGTDPMSTLDVHERARLRRFTNTADAAAYGFLHVLARQRLGAVLGIAPASVTFDRTCPDCGSGHGAPRLVGEPGVHVSLSRTRALVGVAVSRSGPVGFDLERDADTDFPGFDSVAGHPDEARVRVGLSEVARRCRSWVRKEAVLKALGVGLRVDPSNVLVSPGPVAVVHLLGSPSVVVTDVRVSSGYSAAVAVVSDERSIAVTTH